MFGKFHNQLLKTAHSSLWFPNIIGKMELANAMPRNTVK
jgi:hypothetical protein